MIDMEISGEYSNNDHLIVKRKRTKRPRQSISSDFSNSLVVSTSTSPTSSSTGISTSTEEDEDMANCLILLARGCIDSKETKQPETKFRSRKFTEMATSTDGKVGIYVYECRTCSRTFPSFQALGGHRASHRKPKSPSDSDDHKKKSLSKTLVDHDDDHHDQEELRKKFMKINSISTNNAPLSQSQVPKSHECSICGSEFGSGQALGGHMRRHRAAITSTNNTRSVINNDAANTMSLNNDHEESRSNNVLVLDLNLPAPPEEERRETKFNQFSTSQQPRLVFTAAPLVDCHY